MKKILVFISVAALLAASCTKVEQKSLVKDSPITFQTARALTKATGTMFPVDQTFSVYAWSAASVLAENIFMDNVTVAYNTTDNAWVPQGSTYYWPKNASVDFQAYYPAGLAGITVKADKLSYTNIDVKTLQQDIMYSDKAVGYTNNVNEVEDGVNANEGVPVIFRHALSKVKFIVELTYNHKEEADGTVTDWEVTVNNVALDGIYTTGSAEFNLASTPATGLVAWEKPAGNVWTPTSDVASFAGSLSGNVVPGTDYEAVGELYVLPQNLTSGAGQKLTVNVTIKTTRNGVDVLSETFNRTAYLYTASLPAWEINHVYTYRLLLSPTASNGNGGSPIGPGTTIDPSDPDLSDAVITFDPAVDGWQGVGVETTIEL